MPLNNANILTYNFNFQPQHHYPTNLSLKAIPSRILTYTINYKARMGISTEYIHIGDGGKFQFCRNLST